MVFVDYASPVPLQARCAIGTEEEQSGGYHLHEATTPLYLSAAPRGTGGTSTFANYAVWESAERFARAFDDID